MKLMVQPKPDTKSEYFILMKVGVPMQVDKQYCMSSYLAFRYIEDTTKLFFPGVHHNRMPIISNQEKKPVRSASEIDASINQIFASVHGECLGLLLSGGMDSAILASYMPGCDAYTFRFLGGTFQSDELHRAEYYADRYALRLHYVDISWDHVEQCINALMELKGAPVHSIETQIFAGAMQAKRDGITMMVIGDGSDYIFGGMDQLLSTDWTFDAFVNRYTYLNPNDVLNKPADINYLYERFRVGKKIDYLHFMNTVATEESFNSYFNAFQTAGMPYIDPYSKLTMAEPLDLDRVRGGESKYLIRELFSAKYPDIAVPEKVPMPRPVDFYFADWKGPERPEFRDDLDMDRFTGNQKWQMWCLERFLNNHEPTFT